MSEVCVLDWHIAPFRADRWLDLWEPAAARMPAFGAKSWSLTRSIDDPLAFQQTSVWESRSDFERYWFSEEIEAGPRGAASTSTTCRSCPPGTRCSPPSRRLSAARAHARSSGAIVRPAASSCSQ